MRGSLQSGSREYIAQCKKDESGEPMVALIALNARYLPLARGGRKEVQIKSIDGQCNPNKLFRYQLKSMAQEKMNGLTADRSKGATQVQLNDTVLMPDNWGQQDYYSFLAFVLNQPSFSQQGSVPIEQMLNDNEKLLSERGIQLSTGFENAGYHMAVKKATEGTLAEYHRSMYITQDANEKKNNIQMYLDMRLSDCVYWLVQFRIKCLKESLINNKVDLINQFLELNVNNQIEQLDDLHSNLSPKFDLLDDEDFNLESELNKVMRISKNITAASSLGDINISNIDDVKKCNKIIKSAYIDTYIKNVENYNEMLSRNDCLNTLEDSYNKCLAGEITIETLVDQVRFQNSNLNSDISDLFAKIIGEKVNEHWDNELMKGRDSVEVRKECNQIKVDNFGEFIQSIKLLEPFAENQLLQAKNAIHSSDFQPIIKEYVKNAQENLVLALKNLTISMHDYCKDANAQRDAILDQLNQLEQVAKRLDADRPSKHNHDQKSPHTMNHQLRYAKGHQRLLFEECKQLQAHQENSHEKHNLNRVSDDISVEPKNEKMSVKEAKSELTHNKPRK